MKYKQLQFPKDEGVHQTVGEWWYFNGNLKGENGRKYSYMNTLFRVKSSLNHELLEKLSKKDLYFYHSIITNIKNDKCYPHIDYLVTKTQDSFELPGLNVYFSPARPLLGGKHYYMEQDKSHYRIKGEGLRLEMDSKKPPLLENQTGYVNFFNRSTFYYSLTNLETSGSIIVGGKEIKVTGKSWMDHQWSNTFDVTKDSWNWFSVQLENEIELVCYEYKHRGQSAYIATAMDKNGNQKSTENIKITPQDKRWTSPKTEAVYDLAWHIEIPEFDMKLEIESEVENHEINFLNINYWESPIRIKAWVGKKEFAGHGYMELAGRSTVFRDIAFAKNIFKSKPRKI